MAQSSMSVQQQHKLLRMMRNARIAMYGAAGLLFAIGLVNTMSDGAISQMVGVEQSNVTTGASSDIFMSWALGVVLLGFVVTAIGWWIRRLLQPRCEACRTRTELGAKFCQKCGAPLPYV